MKTILQYRRAGDEGAAWQAFSMPMTFSEAVRVREFELPEQGDNWTTANESMTYLVLTDPGVDPLSGWLPGKKGDKYITYVPVRAYPKDQPGDSFPQYIDLERFTTMTYVGNPKDQEGSEEPSQ